MSVYHKYLAILRSFIIYWILIFFQAISGFSQYNHGTETALNDIRLSTDSCTYLKGWNGKPNESYRYDSIFSLRSQKGYLPSLFHNLGAQASAPLHFDLKEWMITGAAIGITAALYSADGRIDDYVNPVKAGNDFINTTSPVITEFGNRYGIYLVGAIGGVSAVFNNKKGVHTSLLASQAMITSGIWAQFIKLLTGRERPKGAYLYSQTYSGKWYGPFSRFNNEVSEGKSIFAFDAFPSGHTAVAFSIATVFATQYSDIKAVPVICYSSATIIGVTRMIEHEHWASDVFTGALIGYLCGKQVVRHFKETHPLSNDLQKDHLSERNEITLVCNGSMIGLYVKW